MRAEDGVRVAAARQHQPEAHPSAAGWLAACPCGWRGDVWWRAKNRAISEARGHVRSESIRRVRQ